LLIFPFSNRARGLLAKLWVKYQTGNHYRGLVRDGKVVKKLFDPLLTIKEDDVLLVFGDPSCTVSLEELAKAT
jgi:hypothetical protein